MGRPVLNAPQHTSKVAARTLRKRVHDILELDVSHDPVSSIVNTFIVVLIFLNVVAFSAETVPALQGRYGFYFRLFDAFSVAIFSLEYAYRIWSCVEIPVFRRIAPWRARWRFAVRPMQLIDLFAVLPFYLSFVLPLDLRILRILRIFRFLKLARYSPALQSLGRVLSSERRALIGALLVMIALLLFAATGIYYLERHAQPEIFDSIPSAAWWALATLTTVGYGDVVPITTVGKMFGGLIMIFGLGMFALPIAIIATGFSQQANRHEFVVTWAMVARVPLFAQLDAASVANIMSLLYSRQYEMNSKIFVAGTRAEAMYFIASGEVIVHTSDGDIVLGEGDFFGEMALIEDRPRKHSVMALTKCRLLVLDSDDFTHLAHQEPDISNHIHGVAKARAQAGKASKAGKAPKKAAKAKRVRTAGGV